MFVNLLETMKTNNQFWFEKISDHKYYIGFKESVIKEIEDLSFIQLIKGIVEADEHFLEVESKKATFEFTLPITINVVEDLTEKLQNNFTASQALAIVEIAD